MIRFIASVWLLVITAAGSLQLAAQTPAEAAVEETVSAHQVVRETTQAVMATVAEAQDYADEDFERYFLEVQSILDPVIDFRGFARSVMGPYASRERYRSLDAAGREQLKGQLKRFSDVMRDGLVRTYSKGILAFGGSRIEISQPSDEEPGQPRVAVQQLIYSDQVEPYVVSYQMGRSKAGEWKLRNVIIEGVNLGEIYRSQFQAAARKHEGDLDAVIDNWTAVEVEQ
jgi:phospholipid transport system substrate-binding protein